MANSCSVISSDELMRIHRSVQEPAVSDAQARRLHLKQLSDERAGQWPNTISAQRARKERARVERLEQEEIERKEVDRQDAIAKAEQRRIQIERANKMLYDDTDRVKAFHSTLLLSDVLQEREAQIEYKKSLSDIKQKHERAFVEQQRMALERAEIAELRKAEERRARFIKERDDQLDQLEQTKVKLLADQEQNRLEGLELKARAQAEAEELAAKEEARRMRNEQNQQATMRANEALQKFKIEEKQREIDAEEKIRVFAEHKEKMLVERRARDVEKAAAKQAQKQKMIDKMEAELMAARQVVDTRIDRQQQEIRIKEDQRDQAHKEWLAREQLAIDASRQQQLEISKMDKEYEQAEEQRYVAEWRDRNEQIVKEEEQKVLDRKMTNKKHQNFLLKQAHNKEVKVQKDKAQKLEEALLVRRALREDDAMFEHYAEVCTSEWARQGKNLKPVQIGLAKQAERLAGSVTAPGK